MSVGRRICRRGDPLASLPVGPDMPTLAPASLIRLAIWQLLNRQRHQAWVRVYGNLLLHMHKTRDGYRTPVLNRIRAGNWGFSNMMCVIINFRIGVIPRSCVMRGDVRRRVANFCTHFHLLTKLKAFFNLRSHLLNSFA